MSGDITCEVAAELARLAALLRRRGHRSFIGPIVSEKEAARIEAWIRRRRPAGGSCAAGRARG